MDPSTRRLFIVALIGCFPLALIGRMSEQTDPERAVRLYRISILILITFFCFLALYTYQQGGNFIKPMATFY